MCLVNAIEGWWPIDIGKNDSNEHGKLYKNPTIQIPSRKKCEASDLYTIDTFALLQIFCVGTENLDKCQSKILPSYLYWKLRKR